MSTEAAHASVTLADHLPALQVAVPLLGAVAAAMVRRGAIAWLVTVIVAWLMPVIALGLLYQVLATGAPVSYALGGWPPPIGIEYRVDEANAFLLLLVSIMAALVTIYMPRSIADEIPPERQCWYYAIFQLCLCGLLGMVITGDAFNIFVFMEVSSLATYVLIAMGRDRRALVSAYQYLVIGTIGATFYVIGVGLLLTMTGTLNLVDMAARLEAVENTRPLIAALAFIGVGISLKLALFPLHLWLPNAYAYAPSAATAFLASTATKVAVYVLLRFLFSVFGVDITFGDTPAAKMVLVLAVLAMLAPSTVAIFQTNVKRMLAYSSVAQIGYIMLGVALVSQTGLTGGISHLFNHAIIKGCLFLAVGCMVYSTGITRIEQMAGIGRTMPVTMGAFVVAGLGLIGVPGTAGFVSKWFLIMGAVEQGLWWLAAVIVMSSLLAVIYVGRIVEIAWFRAPAAAAINPRNPPAEMVAITWVLAAATIYFGFDTRISAGVAGQAAELLLAGYR
ncbi:MAG TPA: monovalent cation/H+ antiporter subunit D family protein [Thermohalobaculum sp.]|nr:monovalent cation/H+ antiporter subunit D family protein [Thermohalobaculum sp.]